MNLRHRITRSILWPYVVGALSMLSALVFCYFYEQKARATVQIPNYGNSANPLSTADANGTGLTLCQRDSAGGGTFTTVYSTGLQTSGYLQLSVVSKTTTYAMNGTESVVEANATGGIFTVTLPAASATTGR